MSTLDKLVGDYIALRDKRQQLKKQHEAVLEPYDRALKNIEQRVLSHMNSSGVESVRTVNGTAYKKTTTSVRVVDREAFLNFIKQEQDWGLLDASANKSAAREYVEANGIPPAGVDVTLFLTVGFQRG